MFDVEWRRCLWCEGAVGMFVRVWLEMWKSHEGGSATIFPVPLMCCEYWGSHYWWGYSRSSGKRHLVILDSHCQSIPCASKLVCCNCLWMTICVNHVPVVGWSRRLILQMLRIPIGSVWVSCSIIVEFSITMLSHFCCSLQCHIYRILTTVLLLVWKILCCWLGHPWRRHVGGI